MSTQKQREISSLSDLMSPDALQLLNASGSDLVQHVGIDVVRGVVFDVLTGRNLRDSTETLTRRRLAALNLATVDLFLRGATRSADFIEQLPNLAVEILSHKPLKQNEKWLAEWTLGLTDKGVQNILRDSPDNLLRYRDQFVETCRAVIADHEATHGELHGLLELGAGVKAEVDWLLMTYLLNTIGAQTLAIRGAEKSAHGKLFEKLVLGSLLHILGFKHVMPPLQDLEGVFWLSTQGEKRESDATLLVEAGKGVRFDIGFIGRGNPEISLDKVSRFEREITLGRSRWYMATIILVDRIGSNSRIVELAKAINGTIIQMSAGYWPQQVAKELNHALGFQHELVNMDRSQIDAFLRQKLNEVPLEQFIGAHAV